ncbi:ADRM1 [Bugula neritina]|uniref:ADRM1 n=1 Tax=Bugula neritina TaxID=10212 RepID=A0A7J7JDF8_BUGNE|nr:ADRM1 [Bugula neritina]
MASALFGNSTQRQGGKKNLLEFKAGKMYIQGKMCYPDKRKGTVFVHQSDDSLMHFCWKDRTTGKVEDDLLIFPDDTEFKRVPQCTTGRVFVLKFKASTKKIFWLQEPKTDKDEEYCKKVNELLNNPPTPGSSRAAGFGTGSSGMADIPSSDLANLGDSDLSNLLGGMSQEQLLRLIGGVGNLGSGGGGAGLGNALRGSARPASTQSQDSAMPVRVQSAPETQPSMEEDAVTPQPRPVTAAALPGGSSTTDSSSAASQSIQLSDLQNVLSSIQTPGNAAEAVNLSEALNSEKMIPILADPRVQERLTPFLPQDSSIPSSQDELRATISSPQFQQALNSFSSALTSGQLGPVLAQFGLSEAAVAAANQGDIQAFVKAMQGDESKKEEKMDES